MLTESTWTKYLSATDEFGQEVRWDSQNAVKRDLTSAIKYQYDDDEQMVTDAIFKIKSVLNIDPVLTAIIPDKTRYWDEFGPLFSLENPIWEETPLYMYNDAMTWQQMQRLLILVDLK